jgi:hypothetical protein
MENLQNGRTHFLSHEERAAGLRAYLQHATWNGLGISFLNVNVISLMAINAGASNVQLGYVNSVFHVAGIVLLFVPYLVQGRNIGRVFFWAWMLRGLVCFLYGALLFLEGQVAVVWIMLVYTAFAVTRMFGMPMSQPLQKRIVRPAEEGQLVTQMHLRLSISQLLSQIISFLFLSLQTLSGTLGLVSLTYMGATANTIASSFIRKIPSRETVEFRRGRNLFHILLESIKRPNTRNVLMVRWFSLAGTVLFSFGIAFLRRGVGMPSNLVFLYTIAGAVSAILASYLLKPLSDNIGSRPLLILSNVGLATLAMIWAFLPTVLPWVLYYLMGFATFFFLRARLLTISRLIIRSIPEGDKIGYTAMLNFFSALAALGAGLAGGALADVAGRLALPMFHTYSFTYFLAAALSIGAGVVSVALEDRGSMSLRQTASVLFSAKYLKTYMDIHRLDISEDPVRRELTLISLEQSDTPAATDRLQTELNSPLVWEKQRILRSLYAYPRPDLLPDIIDEARDPNSYNRLEAISALGSYEEPQAKEVLRECLEEEDPAVQAAALKSLAAEDENEIAGPAHDIAIRGDVGAQAAIDAFDALARADGEGVYLRELFELGQAHRGPRYSQAIFAIAARHLDLTPGIAEFYATENGRPKHGFQDLLFESRQVVAFHDDYQKLKAMVRARNWPAIHAWCAETAKHASTQSPWCHLAAGIRSAPVREATYGMAMLYFTYQTMRHR